MENTNKIPDISQRIIKVRKLRKLTQKEFAKAIGVSQGSISIVEKGQRRPPSKVLIGIVSCYRDISPDWLLTGQGEMLNSNRLERIINDKSCNVNNNGTNCNVNERIKEILKNKGMTLKEFSRKSDISYSTLQEYVLKGRMPGGESLIKISTELGVSVDWLLTGKELPPYTPPPPKKPTTLQELLEKSMRQLEGSLSELKKLKKL